MIRLELIRWYQETVHEALIARETSFDVSTLTIDKGLLLGENHVLIVSSSKR